MNRWLTFNQFGSGVESPDRACSSLFEKCCLELARLVSSERLTSGELVQILECFPNKRTTLTIWGHVRALRGDSLLLYQLFLNSKWIDKGLTRNSAQLEYRYQALPNDVCISSVLAYLQLVNDSFHGYSHLNILSANAPWKKLVHILSCPNIISLTVVADNVTELVKAWIRQLQIKPLSNSKLQMLVLPRMESPKLLYDLIALLPSVSAIAVSIKPDLLEQIPLLKNLLSFNKTIEKHQDLLKQCFLSFDSKTAVLEIDIGTHQQFHRYEARDFSMEYTVHHKTIYQYSRNKYAAKRQTNADYTPLTHLKRPKVAAVLRTASARKFFESYRSGQRR